MSKHLLFLFLFSSINIALTQQFPNTSIWPETVDSVRFNVEHNITKKMTSPGQEAFSKLLGSKKISGKKGKQLLQKLSEKSSYTKGLALLSHHNLTFLFYKAGKLTLTTHISTLTRNIVHYDSSVQCFQGRISKAMGNYLIRMLYKYGFYERVQKIGDLEGLGR